MRALLFIWVIQGFAAFNLTWGIPTVNLDDDLPFGDTDENAAIAIDPMGNAIATWGRTTGNGASEDIWAAVYNHDLRVWTSGVKISGGGNAMNSRVTMDNSGNAVIVWDEGFPAQIMSRTLNAQGVWTPDLASPPDLVYESKNSQTCPQVATDSAGDALVVWMEFFNGSYHIQSAKKPFRNSWISLGEISAGNQSAVLISDKSIAMNGAGNAIAVWQEIDNSIHAAQYMNGSWRAPLPVYAPAQYPAVGIDDAGHGVIVWNQGNLIQSKTIIDGELSKEPLTISDPGYMCSNPDVGVDASGNAVVVYERHDSMHKFIAGSTLKFGTSAWSDPVDISGPSPSDLEDVGYPVLALNAIGDGVAIWKEKIEDRMMIQGAGYSLGTWSLMKTLSSLNDPSGVFIPTMAVSVNVVGNIMAVWPEDLDGNGNIQIKATSGVGLANNGPLSPKADPETVFAGIVTGYQELHEFPAHADIINILKWSPVDGVDSYNIYRNNLSSFVANSRKPKFEDHQRAPKQKVTYLITAVDKHGQESNPMTIVVQPKY